jgi:hypothetical protein
MAWDLTGNANTNSNINFLGTTGNEPLILKTNNQEVVRRTGPWERRTVHLAAEGRFKT